jgi:DNA segregation ATPase FtsK/SpoIIIE, S-DNA-T family
MRNRMAEKENVVKDRAEMAEQQDRSVAQGLRREKNRPPAPPPVEPEPPVGKMGRFIGFLGSERGRKTFGLVVILTSAVMLVSFISHFFTGYQDQAGGGMPANWLGGVGAWLSELFVRKGFGLLAVPISLYTGLWGFAILERKYPPFLFRILKHLFFTVLWGSVFLAFVSFLLFGKPSLLGGGFGWYMNELLMYPFGRLGTGLIVVVSFLVYLVVNFNVDLPFSKLLPRKPEEVPAAPATEAEPPAAPTDNAIVHASPVPGDGEDEAEAEGDEMDFVISVRPAVEEKPEPPAPKGRANVKPFPAGGEVPFEITPVPEAFESQAQEPAFVQPEAPPFAPQPKAPVPASPPVGPAFEVSLPSPDEIPELNTYRDYSPPAGAGFDFSIEDSRVRDGADKAAFQPPAALPFAGDNIHEVEEELYEKIVPEDSLETLDPEDEVADWTAYDPTLELSTYQYPTIDLLEHRDGSQNREVNRGELEENKNKIVQTLQHYKIDITSIKATIGPTVTLYEIVPAPGVRISKIRNLEDDIALSLAALGIRIIAPIPGKGTIGIEIPNSKPEVVSMRSVMSTEKFRDSKAELPLVLGRTISNEVFIADLAKMPHLLIAGATGQGKSVGINGIISSILYKKHPSQVKFVLIDPKKVELSLYSNLESHFLAMLETSDEPIITDTKQVIGVLNSLCKEMDARYDLLKKAGVRNLLEYNGKFTSRRLNPKKGHRFLPYIVLIIDEFADLMMTAGKEIETPIARLAQLARAIGIHLILATQRPSVNVITGIIKANFPARISFRVTSKVDSRTILDTGGADQLVGRGDLLLSTGSEIVRIQNAFIDTPEVENLVNFIADQRGYPTPYYLPEVQIEGEEEGFDDEEMGERDDFFSEAARLVVKHQQGSTSLIQRRLKLGYNRAGRIIDELEKAGIVGAFQGSKAREVLVHDEYTLEQILNALN